MTTSMNHNPVKYVALLLLWAMIGACTDFGSAGVQHTDTQLSVTTPEGVKDLQIVSQKVQVTNLSTGTTTTLTTLDNLTLPEGLYDMVYSADVTYTAQSSYNETAQAHGRLTGKAENVQVTGTTTHVKIDTYLSAETDDFIFEEIFFSGTLRSSGLQYYGDSYIKIYNNTDHVLYADGLAFCESKFKSTQNFEYSPDIRKDTMSVWSLYVIPGSGHDHPVLPGHSLIICDTGIDHRTANPNSFDLSAADWEWYDVSTRPDHMDIDSETVPNLDKWYCYTLSFYVLHNRGFTSFALARIPIDKLQYLKDYKYTYKYTMYLPAGTFPMEQDAYKIPNSWIVDGVNCSIEAKRLWNILPPSVDAGWTHCGKIDKDETRYFRSVRRKLQYLNADGTMHLQDTNNSTEDFNTECIPSIIEAQHTAIDAQGTRATTETYDGVVPKK
ncbi:MAG: DUF4876 domain-containing protein [Prevotellaceae bacterium]|nr:DUF4876 domain-containing protein [Prevotellaceae bacterium]